MRLSVHPYFLKFYRPFALAHGIRSGTQLAFVRIEFQGTVVYGEASLPPYLPETFESVKRWVEEQVDQVKECLGSDPFTENGLLPFSNKDPAASAALQMAILNWHSVVSGIPLSEWFDSTSHRPGLSLTLTKEDVNYLDEKIDLAQRFTHLKLKLTGTDDDLDFVQSIRKRTTMPFCIDVNQGFRSREAAVRAIAALENQNCILIEQPLKDKDHEGHAWLKQRISLPIIADESIRSLDDLRQYHEAYSGLNIKLMKCGGLFQALQMLEFIEGSAVHESYLKVLGCMSESSLAVATSAVLSSRFDIADLDAPYLCKNDPFEGFEISAGEIQLAGKIRLRTGYLID